MHGVPGVADDDNDDDNDGDGDDADGGVDRDDGGNAGDFFSIT